MYQLFSRVKDGLKSLCNAFGVYIKVSCLCPVSNNLWYIVNQREPNADVSYLVFLLSASSKQTLKEFWHNFIWSTYSKQED